MTDRMKMPDLGEITNLVQNNELRTALDDLLVICKRICLDELYDDLSHLKAKFSKNNRANRNGVIDIEEYNREENRIRQGILDIKREIEDIPGINKKIRRAMKEILELREKLKDYIIIDYSEATEGEMDTIEFQLDEFEDAEDLMNGIYLKMLNHFPTFSYGEKWKLVNPSGADAIEDIAQLMMDRAENRYQGFEEESATFKVVKLS